MHGGDARMAKVMRTLRPALASAQAIYLETADEDLERLDSMPAALARSFLLPKGQELRHLLPAPGLGAVSADRPAGRRQPGNHEPDAALGDLDVRGTKRLPPPTALALRRGLDDRIAGFAQRKRIPLGALETPEQALRAIASLPLRDQARMLELELELVQSGKPEDATPG